MRLARWSLTGVALVVCFWIGLIASVAIATSLPYGYEEASAMVLLFCFGLDFFAFYQLRRLITAYQLKRLAGSAVRRRWYQRSAPGGFAATYEVRPEGLFTATPYGHHTTYWSAIGLVQLLPGYWIISADTGYLPRRLFASAEAERAFMAALFEHLPPETQQGSPTLSDFLSKSA